MCLLTVMVCTTHRTPWNRYFRTVAPSVSGTSSRNTYHGREPRSVSVQNLLRRCRDVTLKTDSVSCLLRKRRTPKNRSRLWTGRRYDTGPTTRSVYGRPREEERTDTRTGPCHRGFDTEDPELRICRTPSGRHDKNKTQLREENIVPID